MKNIIVFTTIVLSACCTEPPTSKPSNTVTPAQEHHNPVASIKPARTGLSDLDAMTFRCPQAGLNAAAREAAKAPSQGYYQFAYFNIINDSHYSLYQVNFKSNYQSEADLNYCVSVYCQQGQDPAPSVSLIGKDSQPAVAIKGDMAHSADCGSPSAHVQKLELKRQLKK